MNPGHLLAMALMVTVASAQSGARDRYFTRYPFDQWLADGEKTKIHWTARVVAPHLTPHQRLAARVEINIDAREVAKRRGRGEFVAFVQIEDAAGHRWRTHRTYSLLAIPADAKARDMLYTQELFVLPGDYTFSLAVCDSGTGEYSLVHHKLHVAELRADPLPAAWRDLPPLEFVQHFDAPDVWYQPYVHGRVRLQLETRRPVHLDLVMNMTPSERVSGSIHTFRRNMSVLVPALKVLSNLEPPQGTLDVALLDLTRRRTWEQKDVRGLDWNRLRELFADTNPAVIDAESLAAKAQMKQFFWEQILERLRPDPDSEALHVMVVLSAPAFLDRQFKVEPATFPKDPNRRVFYLRYRPTPPPRATFNSPNGAFERGLMPTAGALPEDDLEHTLKSLDAKVYSAITAEEFRKAISNVMAEVARM